MWSWIKGYRGYYRISTSGKVRSVDRVIPRVYRGPFVTLKGKSVSRVPTQDGYLQVNLWKEGVGKKLYVHRLVLETFVGPCPPGMQCLHKDDNPANNHLSNLSWGTPAANSHQRDTGKPYPKVID